MPKTRNHKRKNSRKSRKNRNKKGAGLFTKSPEMKLAEKLRDVMYCLKKDAKVLRTLDAGVRSDALSEMESINDKVKNAVNNKYKTCPRGVGIEEMLSNDKLKDKLKNANGCLHEKVIDKLKSMRVVTGHGGSDSVEEYVYLFSKICQVVSEGEADQVTVDSQPDTSIPMVSTDQDTVVSGGKRKSHKNRRNRRNRRSRRNKNKRSRKHR